MLTKFRQRLVFLLTTGAFLSFSQVAAQPTQLNLPARPVGSMAGVQFKDYIVNMPRSEREIAIYREIVKGNVPDFIRNLTPVTTIATISSQVYTGTFYVVPEYMAVGSDADYFRIPMSPILAQWVADAAECILPTRKMVNAIAATAPCRLAPSPIAPGPQMVTVPVFWDHNVTVQGQRTANGAALGTLVRGDKKDVVISPLLVTYSDFKRVAIYGWHQLNDSPIQPLYFGHEETYADYSHGTRLVNRTMVLNGIYMQVSDVLTSTAVGTLLNDEAAPFTTSAPPRYIVPSAPAGFPYADAFPATGRQIGSWIDRFQVHTVSAFSPVSPGGDGFVLTVKDTSGGIDTARLGNSTDSDYFVQCDIYCELRTGVASDGFERVGIFARDNGNGLFCGQNTAGTIKGNNYALTWDSGNGRLQCLKTVNGIPFDLLPAPVFLPGSAWRTMRIETLGAAVTFKVDGLSMLSVVDTSHTQGQFGIGYQEQFITNSNIHGTRADNFSAGLLEAVTQAHDWLLYD